MLRLWIKYLRFMERSAHHRLLMYIKTSSVILFFYFALAIAFFFVMGDAMLDGESNIQFFADSSTYEQAAIDLKGLTSLELVILNPNYFGPITILDLMNGSRWGVLTLNLTIFTLSISFINKAVPLNRNLFIILMILNPMTFSSLLSINKEIFSLLTVALLIYGINKRSLPALIACAVASFLVRWQLSLFVIVFLGLISPFNPLRHRLFLTFLISITTVSILYYLALPSMLSHTNEVAELGAENWEGTGLWGKFLDVQNSGGYFLVFIPKLLQAMFGILVYINKILNPPEFYNYVVVMLHSLVTLFVLVYAFIQGKLKLTNNAFYMAMIYSLVFGLTPIYAPRYFYPVFVLLCILVAEKSSWQHDTQLAKNNLK